MLDVFYCYTYKKCLLLLIFVFLCFSSFLPSRDTSHLQALPCSPPAPRLPLCLAVPDSRCSTIFFCDFTEPKSTNTDSSRCCTTAPLSPLSLVTPRCLPLWSSPPSFLPSNLKQPEAFVPPPHLCVSGVLIWSWCCCSATWTHSKISHANTQKRNTPTFGTHMKHSHTVHAVTALTRTLGEWVTVGGNTILGVNNNTVCDWGKTWEGGWAAVSASVYQC